MKTRLLTFLFILLSFGQARAYELRAGYQAAQVRDAVYDDYADKFLGWRFFDLADLQFAGEITNGVDLVGGAKIGSESGVVEGLGSRLLLIEPAFGVRKRYSLFRRLEAFGQATLSVPYMRATFESRSRSVHYNSVFPMLTPSVGLSYFPPGNSGGLGVSANIGLTTPALFTFSGSDGAKPGNLHYGGLTYGLYLVWRSRGAGAEAK